MMKLGSALAVFALATVAPSAQAAMQLSYQINGGAVTNCTIVNAPPISNGGTDDGPNICTSISSGGITISELQGSSNSPGTASLAKLFATELEVTNTSGAPATVNLWVSTQNFTQPTVPPGTILWQDNESMDGTAGPVTGDATDCVAPNNALQSGPVATYCSTSGDLMLDNTPISIPATGGSNSHTTTTSITSLSGPYSISTEIQLTLGAGADFHFEDSQSLTPVPEPMSIGLLGGVLLLSARALRRKRGQLSA